MTKRTAPLHLMQRGVPLERREVEKKGGIQRLTASAVFHVFRIMSDYDRVMANMRIFFEHKSIIWKRDGVIIFVYMIEYL